MDPTLPKTVTKQLGASPQLSAEFIRSVVYSCDGGSSVDTSSEKVIRSQGFWIVGVTGDVGQGREFTMFSADFRTVKRIWSLGYRSFKILFMAFFTH